MPLLNSTKKISSAIAALSAVMLGAVSGAFGAGVPTKVLEVAPNIPGDIGTIQQAIDSVKVNSKTPVTILVRPGIYHERINIPANLPPISLIGENPANTIIAYSLIAYDKGSDGKPIGMWNTATARIRENNFSAMNITFVNDGGQGGKFAGILIRSW